MKFLVKFLKNPCDICITQAVCQGRTYLWKSRNCPEYKRYNRKKNSLGDLIDIIFDYTILLLMLVGIVLIIVTFGFGLKGWWDISVRLFEWLFV